MLQVAKAITAEVTALGVWAASVQNSKHFGPLTWVSLAIAILSGLAVWATPNTAKPGP